MPGPMQPSQAAEESQNEHGLNDGENNSTNHEGSMLFPERRLPEADAGVAWDEAFRDLPVL
jgi:hypothetical protein